MNPSCRVVWMMIIMCLLHGVNGILDNEDQYMEDYFYQDEDAQVTIAVDEDVLNTLDKIILTPEDVGAYEEYLSSPKRKQDVIVLLSTSEEALLVFEKAVESLISIGLVNVTESRFFAVPITPSQDTTTVDDFDHANAPTFGQLHELGSVPASGLHIVAEFPVASGRSLVVHSSNAKLVKATTEMSEWVHKLYKLLETIKSRSQESAVKTESSSTIPNVFVIGVIAYLIFIVAPKVIQNWKYLLELAQSKQLWLFVSLTVMYISISGTFYSIIHTAPLFYVSSQGFSLVHPQSQRQFALEGLFAGMFPFAVSAALLTVSHAMPYVFKPDNRFHCVTMWGMVIFISIFLEHALFMSKNRWYRLF